MTTRDLIDLASQHGAAAAALLLLPVVLAALLPQLHGRDGATRSPWRYVYATVVYLACIPGVFASLLTGYTAMFTRESLLDQSVVVFVLPIATMVATLVIVSRNVVIERVPGFERLSGLLTLLAVTFVLLFLLARTRLWIVFGGSIFSLLALGAGLFVALKLATRRAFGASR